MLYQIISDYIRPDQEHALPSLHGRLCEINIIRSYQVRSDRIGSDQGHALANLHGRLIANGFTMNLFSRNNFNCELFTEFPGQMLEIWS